MNLQAEKIELAKMLLETDDRSLLKNIRSLFVDKKENIITPQWVINGVRKSQEQFKKGEYLSYEEVKKQLDNI